MKRKRFSARRRRKQALIAGAWRHRVAYEIGEKHHVRGSSYRRIIDKRRRPLLPRPFRARLEMPAALHGAGVSEESLMAICCHQSESRGKKAVKGNCGP